MGRGFDSRRLHQASFAASGELRPGKPGCLPAAWGERSRATSRAGAATCPRTAFATSYILVGEADDGPHCTGLTRDLESELQAHNARHVPHRAKSCPWRLETAIGFRSRPKAAVFEHYFKSHSGRAFT